MSSAERPQPAAQPPGDAGLGGAPAAHAPETLADATAPLSPDAGVVLVRELMTHEVFTLSAQQSVPLAQALMSMKHIRHVPIVDAAGHLEGLVTHRDLLSACISTLAPLSDDERSSLQLSVPIARIMQRDVWTVASTAPALSAARLMSDHRVGCLPVVDDGKLVGILTGTDLLDLVGKSLARGRGPRLEADRERWRVAHAMTTIPLTIGRETSIEQARGLMQRFGVRHLPVVEHGKPVAIVSDADLRVAEVVYRECGQKTQASLATYFCGVERLFTTTPEAHLGDVLLQMWRDRLDAAVVVSHGGLVGILTTSDACRLFGEHLVAQHPAAASG